MKTPLSGYQKSWFRSDLLAGISVAAVALPIAMAYAHLAGVPPVYGLYASLLPLVAYALLGSSRQLIIAPDAATCAIVASVVAPLAGHDIARYVSLSAALALICGIYCIGAGFAGLGFLTNFLSRPILTGYLNGIAIWIITGQLGGLFGFPMPSDGFFRLIWQFFLRLGETHWPTLAVGLATLALLVLFARFAPKVPGPLVAMVLGIVCSEVFGFAKYGIKVLGTIPSGLPAFTIPNISAADWGHVAVGAAGLALISYTSAMVTARGFAAKNHYDIDSNREFIALGVADIGSGILQGFAVSGADSRTAMDDSAGGKTQVTGLVTSAVLALTLLFLTGTLRALPMAVLAAVLVMAAVGLFDLRGLVTLSRVSPQELLVCIITLLGVITVGVLQGVVVAIAVAGIQMLTRNSRPHDAVVGRIPGTNAFLSISTHPEAETFPGLLIYRFDAYLVFFNADYFKARVRTLVGQTSGAMRFFLLDAETIPYMDTTGAASLGELCDILKDQGIATAIAAAKAPVRTMLDKTGLSARIGSDRVFISVGSAVEALLKHDAEPIARAGG